MPDTQALEALLARVEGATGSDREIDADIYEALGYTVKRQSKQIVTGWRSRRTVAFRYRDGRSWIAMGLLSHSIDDITSMIKKELPEWNAAVWIDDEPQGSVYPKEQPFPADMDIYAAARTPPLALCAAFLRAKLAIERQP